MEDPRRWDVEVGCFLAAGGGGRDEVRALGGGAEEEEDERGFALGVES